MTTVAIHQPNYLPYLGYFDKIRNCDIFVFLDNVRYSIRAWTGRNKIKTPIGWRWISVPVVNKDIMQTRVCDVKISNTFDWRRKHWNQLKHNYARALSFKKYKDFFEGVYNAEWTMLAELNEYLVKEVCKFLSINGIFINASTLDVDDLTGTSLLIKICEVLDADIYFSGAGSGDYLDSSQFEERGIDVIIQEFKSPIYPQLYGEFIPNLSVIDFLLNCGDKQNW